MNIERNTNITPELLEHPGAAFVRSGSMNDIDQFLSDENMGTRTRSMRYAPVIFSTPAVRAREMAEAEAAQTAAEAEAAAYAKTWGGWFSRNKATMKSLAWNIVCSQAPVGVGFLGKFFYENAGPAVQAARTVAENVGPAVQAARALVEPPGMKATRAVLKAARTHPSLPPSVVKFLEASDHF